MTFVQTSNKVEIHAFIPKNVFATVKGLTDWLVNTFKNQMSTFHVFPFKIFSFGINSNYLAFISMNLP